MCMTKRKIASSEPAAGRTGGPTANRNHKNSLFLSLFKQPEDLLDLYNAVNGSHYTDPSLLEINTLEEVLYLGIKNDISFLFSGEMNLYEHQSTDNPNMPLRGLFYFAKLYQVHVGTHNLDIYSRKQLKLPTPRYIVFYNGTGEMPERTVLRLSTSFEGTDGPLFAGEPPSLECTATVLNTNYGHNREIMERCQKLRGYAYLISRIRYHLGQGLTLEAAVGRAIDDCLEEDILTEYLTKCREEATMNILSEYDQEKILQFRYEEGKEEGKVEGGLLKLLSLICRKLKKGKSLEQIADELDEDISEIQPLYEMCLPFAPDYDAERIYEVWKADADDSK